MLSADGSVGSPHVRVGHRQALYLKGRSRKGAAFFVIAPEEAGAEGNGRRPSQNRSKRQFLRQELRLAAT